MTKPLALTMGEPAGVGMELTAKAWRAREAECLPPFLVLCDPAQLAETEVPVQAIDDPARAVDVFESFLPVFPISLPVRPEAGTPDVANVPAVLESIETAVSFALAGRAGGVVTNPVHKDILKKGGFRHPGHTEFLGALCGIKHDPVMMLAAQDLRVVPLTVHLALSDVPAAVTQDMILRKAHMVAAALRQDFGIGAPRLAVAGLNPHAGEGGAFGREEIEVILPAIERLKAEGLDISGPHPADTMFHDAARKTYDAALCMYHDQALIPLKTLDFYGGVNVTLGLPIVRTSPDHGTALNIAGHGIARPDSLISAIKTADKMVQSRGI
ncbi:MAG: 4-hydroxythreonine-4-phosphate dehydrogenase PdxA [Rhodospirillales bacterium]|nr:4-hydroxythreonine-4-phosphate dehydrogenase PdxA [Alphaproteobacteria bacterium]USO04284.1 MAG: 4-hydroxythreonine-4-phosphate dehydrogenase PdxA [Rhodospirillales bacterium]